MITTKSGLKITIRQEKPADYTEVNALIDVSFAINDADAGDTADYFTAVRKKDIFVPELSLVAVLTDGKIVGQVALYETDIITETDRIVQLVLSPISVLPAFFNRGIAREMIAYSLSKAKEMGYTAAFLQGNPRFYEKFGFEPAYKRGIYHETDADKTAEHCMVNVLVPGALDGITGTTYYD